MNTPPTDRCPHCSFQPESLNDYCEKHRTTPPTGRDEMPEWAIASIEFARLINRPGLATAPTDDRACIVWLADDRDRLQARIEQLERSVNYYSGLTRHLDKARPIPDSEVGNELESDAEYHGRKDRIRRTGAQ